jgi:catechol 2,3-dioxygenase-like lactoylglutathione lyase family enzyme
MYRGFQIAPNASLVMDNVNFIIFPMEYAKTQWPELWKDRNDFEPTTGHVTDHLAFSVDNLDQALERMKKDGVKITEKPRSAPGGRHAFIEGPDHVKIELVEGMARNE